MKVDGSKDPLCQDLYLGLPHLPSSHFWSPLNLASFDSNFAFANISCRTSCSALGLAMPHWAWHLCRCQTRSTEASKPSEISTPSPSKSSKASKREPFLPSASLTCPTQRHKDQGTRADLVQHHGFHYIVPCFWLRFPCFFAIGRNNVI